MAAYVALVADQLEPLRHLVLPCSFLSGCPATSPACTSYWASLVLLLLIVPACGRACRNIPSHGNCSARLSRKRVIIRKHLIARSGTVYCH